MGKILKLLITWLNSSENQSLLLLEKLNELDLDVEADLCEKLHDDAEHLFRTLSSGLDELQDGN
ncbi:Rop family plasmid primer RNA-binding protein [Klebsiella pneumoniae]|nr:Rop family plasmid primer RNA-binding protein [Klebsiella pneumoniae]